MAGRSKDEAFNEIKNFFEGYITNQEYTQHNDSVDKYYAQLGGSVEQQITSEYLESNQVVDKGNESQQQTGKLEESKDGKFISKAPTFDMNSVHELGFREEKTKIPVLSEPQKKGEYNFFNMLENSFANMPRENDMFPTVLTKEKTTNQTLLPKRRIVDERSFEKMELDTLFAIFFFQKGTYDQFLAAEELKRRTWRFHKKHLSWFKRCDQPKVMTDEYEEGTYYSIDYENNDWAQRKKNDFMIRYSYLEKD